MEALQQHGVMFEGTRLCCGFEGQLTGKPHIYSLVFCFFFFWGGGCFLLFSLLKGNQQENHHNLFGGGGPRIRDTQMFCWPSCCGERVPLRGSKCFDPGAWSNCRSIRRLHMPHAESTVLIIYLPIFTVVGIVFSWCVCILLCVWVLFMHV